MTDPRSLHAPDVLRALQTACVSARASVDGDLLELARLRLATLLGDTAELDARPWGALREDHRTSLARWTSADCFDERQRAALALTEQFTIDVTGVSSGPLASAAGSLRDQLVPFVQSLYLLDVGQRTAMVLSEVFDVTVTSDDWAWGDQQPVDVMAAVMNLLAAVGRLQSTDPITRELVRLRGARAHVCRRCQSVRSVAAIRAGADLALLDADDPSTVTDLDRGTRAAIDLVDATFVGPPSVDDDLRARLLDSFDAPAIVELTSYLLRNASNKISVAFGADAAIVDEGHEYQVIDDDGQTVTVDASALA